LIGLCNSLADNPGEPRSAFFLKPACCLKNCDRGKKSSFSTISVESGWCGPISAPRLGQSHGAASNWTKVGLIRFDSSFARAILGNEDSMDGCRPVIYMFDQADHLLANLRRSGAGNAGEIANIGRWKRKSAVRQIGLNDRSHRPVGARARRE
jgi:hypothetical protein